LNIAFRIHAAVPKKWQSSGFTDAARADQYLIVRRHGFIYLRQPQSF
jgi:hypothetical protein